MSETAPGSGQAAVCAATVTVSRRAGAYRLLAFRAPEIAAAAMPGQFVTVAQAAPGHILRRPFSILGVDGDDVRIVFDVIGPGTAWLAARSRGERLDVVGPLGRPFDPPPQAGRAVLVGGGCGAAPLLFLAERLRTSGHTTHLIIGAATRGRLLDMRGARRVADRVTLVTEDGSAGVRGMATDALSRDPSATVFACGPMPMLSAVARFAREAGMPCQVAVEEFMACGVGVCWTCVVPVRSDGGIRYARSCTEGPVFDGSAVAWA